MNVQEGGGSPALPGRPGVDVVARPVTVSAFTVREDLVRDAPDPKLR
ncbi:hypothetical protein SAMN06272735_5646 [Streptomyces sp. TLI_55]|nr:hypothetical protein [Streptomyces sp. TLI_55]SNX63834.1 hypothetical protein SAMN06272735_5646 [Streptomyces sp. TLI_55]